MTAAGICPQRQCPQLPILLASTDTRVHFGLGTETGTSNVVVRWPGGEEEAFGDFKQGATYELREGNGEPVSRQGIAKDQRS